MKRTIKAAIVALTSLALVGGPALSASAAVNEVDYVTGYSFYDNDPPGSAEIAHPVIHSVAGGTGTYADPITVAVAVKNGVPVLPWGKRLYFPYLHRYGIVEDECAGCGGSRPSGTTRWLDIWVDGRTDTSSQADACMDKITGKHHVLVGAGRGWKVASGSIARNGGCTRLYGETPTVA